VPSIEVPNLPELAVKKIWREATKIPSWKKYMPDKWNGDHKTERDFFYGILSALKPLYVEKLIYEAKNKRAELRKGKAVKPPQDFMADE
jgi:hypothetical protein